MSALTIPIKHFPLPQDPWSQLRFEAEANAQRVGHLPGMIIGYTGDERLAAVRADLSPAELASVEAEMLSRPAVAWTVFCGEAVLSWGAGAVRHVFLRRRNAAGTWTAALRPVAGMGDDFVWLDEWRELSGDGPESGPLFPEPAELVIRFTMLRE